MDYNPINLFLNKIRKIVSESDLEKDVIQGVLSTYLKIQINRDDIVIKNKILNIKNTSPLIRGEIFMKKLFLLKKLNEAGANVLDIR